MDRDVMCRGVSPCQSAGPDFRHIRNGCLSRHKVGMIMPSFYGAPFVAPVLCAPGLLTISDASWGTCP